MQLYFNKLSFADESLYVYDVTSFNVKDYCVGMSLFGPPSFYSDDPLLEIEEYSSNTSVEGKGLSPELPWEFKLTKSVLSNDTVVEMDYVNYLNYWNPAYDTPPAFNTQCNDYLNYTILKQTWNWSGADVLSKKMEPSFWNMSL